MDVVAVLNFVLNALITIALVAFANRDLKGLRNILDILNNGGFRNCPFYVDQKERGRRWYDLNNLEERLKQLESKEKGGESV